MIAAERQSIEQACARLVANYANLNDRGAWADVAALFVADGRLARPTSPDDWIVGRQAILDAFLARPARTTRHIVGNIVVDVVDERSATGTSAMVLYLADDTCKVGSFDDRFVLTADGWRFVERRGTLSFSTSGPGTTLDQLHGKRGHDE